MHILLYSFDVAPKRRSHMFLKYDLDIGAHSIWNINTPTTFAQKLPFYLNECGRFLAQPNYYTIREGKSDYLLVYTLSGIGGLEYKGKTQSLLPQKAVVVDCRLRSHFFSKSAAWDYYWMHFNGNAASDMVDLLNARLPDTIDVGHGEQITAAMENLFKYGKNNDVKSNLLISESISAILSELVRSIHGVSESDGTQSKDIANLIAYLSEHFQDKITIDKMLTVTHMSKFHFIRSFKKRIGITPYEYLLNLRITNAKRMLRETGESVSTIGVMVGFENPTNFIRKFKSLVGETPLQYRQTYR